MLLRKPQVVLFLIAIILLAATFLKPTLELERATYRYVFVYDISQSMNVMDVPNTNQTITRLDYAKQITIDALEELPCGTEAGLALFTGHRAFLLITPIEVCSNYREFSSILSKINWRMTWEAKSEVAKGLFKSISLLKLVGDETRLVFITDGQESPPINPEIPPRFAGKIDEVNGLILGIGGDEPVQIPKFNRKTGEPEGFWKVDEVQHVDVYTQTSGGAAANVIGTEHLSSLRESYLQGLAEKTGLIYHRINNAEALSDQLKTNHLAIPKTITTDIRWLFALGALLAFIATLLIAPLKKYFN